MGRLKIYNSRNCLGHIDHYHGVPNGIHIYNSRNCLGHIDNEKINIKEIVSTIVEIVWVI